MKRWYATLEIQLAIDVDDDVAREELEERLTSASGVNVDINAVNTYNPDQVDVTYLEADDG